ncbi:hypothetical protein GCM10007301_54230 [Azorhizobium oxalatiphilum]|uniref:Sulfotransferase domain-containing protein n=1 Tax=Azorhizobium oxalatiphilum TaxID=980631 RepID=A0A917CFT7_9HYPH|nr:hypothetical protein [Azorhizobium oxalatiphilum]GGF87492.1 hypothetical protein GCM10007301_54230 [Azorhizobium oxalatiphilum]
MIYLCYGVTKSASTFLYQITEEIFSASGLGFCRLSHDGPLQMSNHYDTIDPSLITRIAESAGERPVVLKTHGALHPGVADMIAAGEVLASASIRDPREIALSMVDHGRRARANGEQAFAEVFDPTEALFALDMQIEIFTRWAGVPQTEVFTYNEICFDTEATIRRLARQIGTSVDPARILAPFRNTRMIGQFNIGRPDRAAEMPAHMQAAFLERYAAFYARMRFDRDPLKAATTSEHPSRTSPTTRPLRWLKQEIADHRRLVRRLMHSRNIGIIRPD